MFVIKGKAGAGVSQRIVELLSKFKEGSNILILDESTQPYEALINKGFKLFFIKLNEHLTLKELAELNNGFNQFDAVVVSTLFTDVDEIESVESEGATFIAKVQLPYEEAPEDSFFD